MAYWDTSALAKLYVHELDSAQFSAYAAATAPVISSDFARLELFRVFARKEAEGRLVSGAAEQIFAKFEADIGAGAVVLFPREQSWETRFQKLVLRLHRLKPPLLIRTIDAVHLTTAEMQAAIEIVASDVNL